MGSAEAQPSVLHCLWTGEVGGMQRAVYQLVREQLRDPAFTPAVLFACDEGPYVRAVSDLDSTVIVPGLRHGHSMRGLPGLVASMRRFDIHHFHGPEPLLILASLCCPGACRVFTFRGGITDHYPLVKRVRYAVTGLLLRLGAHGFSGNTEHATRAAAILFGIGPDRFVATYNGVEFDLLDPRRPAEQVRCELGIEPNDFVLGTAANLKSWKRIERLLLAIAGIPDPRLRLLVVGDGEDRRRLEAMAADLNLGKRAVFAGVQVDIGTYLQVMDAFCLPSTGRESFGNAAVEAMAVGLPTIIFEDGGGMVEHIESGRTGFVVGDQQDLNLAVARLLNDPTLAGRLGAQARSAVRERYTVERAAAAYRSLYCAALSRQGRPLRSKAKAGLRTTARRARWTYRVATSEQRTLPRMIIIGAQKAGTSSLFTYLVANPAIVRPRSKEIHYFDLNYHRGVSWYRAHFPKCGHMDRLAAQIGTEPITLEASPYYLFHPLAPQRVRELLPDVKLMIILRDPVERAISHYHHSLAKRVEPLTIKEAIEVEPGRIGTGGRAGDPWTTAAGHRRFSYLARGVYADQLRTWFSVFERDQFLILDSGQLFADPNAALRRAWAFADLPSCSLPSYAPVGARDYPPVDADVRAHLQDYFAPHNERLWELLGERFDWQ